MFVYTQKKFTMKNILKIASGIALSLILFSACNVENLKETYTPVEVSEVSFTQANINATAIPASQSTFDVVLSRNTPENAVTVNITSTLPSSITVPSSVAFAAGETTAVLSLAISNMSVGSQYKGNLTIDASSINKNVSIATTTLNLAKAYTWVSMGQGEWFDNLALMSADSYGIQPVEVMKAEGFERYRIMNPYANTNQLIAAWSEGNIGTARSAYIEFWVLPNGKNVSWGTFWYCGLIYDGAGTNIKAYLPSYLSATYAADDAKSYIDPADKVAWFYPYWYIDGLGGFGTKYPCVLSFPGGPKLEEYL